MVVRQAGSVFVRHWVSRHAGTVEWKCALMWVARSSDPAHDVHGSRFRALLWEPLLERGGSVPRT